MRGTRECEKPAFGCGPSANLDSHVPYSLGLHLGLKRKLVRENVTVGSLEKKHKRLLGKGHVLQSLPFDVVDQLPLAHKTHTLGAEPKLQDLAFVIFAKIRVHAVPNRLEGGKKNNQRLWPTKNGNASLNRGRAFPAQEQNICTAWAHLSGMGIETAVQGCH